MSLSLSPVFPCCQLFCTCPQFPCLSTWLRIGRPLYKTCLLHTILGGQHHSVGWHHLWSLQLVCLRVWDDIIKQEMISSLRLVIVWLKAWLWSGNYLFVVWDRLITITMSVLWDHLVVVLCFAQPINCMVIF